MPKAKAPEPVPFSYDRWIDEQTAGIIAALDTARRTGANLAAYLIPARPGAGPGKVIAATELPEGATNILLFNGNGGVRTSGLGWVARSSIRSQLWHICRSAPILPR